MKFKSLLSLLLVFLFCVSVLAACKTETEESSQAQADSSAVEESSEPEVIMPEYWGYNAYNRTDIVGAPDEVLS